MKYLLLVALISISFSNNINSQPRYIYEKPEYPHYRINNLKEKTSVYRYKSSNPHRRVFDWDILEGKNSYCDLKLFYNEDGFLHFAESYNINGDLIERTIFSEINSESIKIESFNILDEKYMYWILKDSILIEKGTGHDSQNVNIRWKYIYENEEFQSLVKSNKHDKLLFEEKAEYDSIGRLHSIIQSKYGKIKWRVIYTYNDDNKLHEINNYKTKKSDEPYSICYYAYEPDRAEYIQDSISRNLTNCYKLIYLVDKNNNPIEIVELKKDNSIFSSTSFRYDKNCRTVCEEFSMMNNRFIYRKEFSYNEKGDLTLYEYYTNDEESLSYKEIMEYNESGNIKRHLIFNKIENDKSYYNYEYN